MSPMQQAVATYVEELDEEEYTARIRPLTDFDVLAIAEEAAIIIAEWDSPDTDVIDVDPAFVRIARRGGVR